MVAENTTREARVPLAQILEEGTRRSTHNQTRPKRKFMNQALEEGSASSLDDDIPQPNFGQASSKPHDQY